jgi:acetyl-CoA acetyltransferase
MSGLSGIRAAIAGIGATDFSKDSGRSELRLAVEAVIAALADAGVDRRDVDGLATFTMDGTPESELVRCLGLGDVTFFSRTAFGGGGGCGIVAQAVAAVAAGIAEVVVCYRALNERSGRRFGAGTRPMSGDPTAENIHQSWYLPFGLVTPAARLGMLAQRYMYETGATSEDFGRISVAARANAATNPAAFFYRQPITLEDHQASRIVCEPLRLLDCCLESDGAVAVVVTSLERARKLRRPPVVIEGASQGMGGRPEPMTSYYGASISRLRESEVVARALWDQSGLAPSDIDLAIIYDHFTPLVLMQLEEYGFCPRGGAVEFVRSGEHELGGAVPINPHGGQLGEAYIHGMNGIAEAVRQVRGEAVNQVPEVGHVLVTSGPGVPSSGLVLGRNE